MSRCSSRRPDSDRSPLSSGPTSTHSAALPHSRHKPWVVRDSAQQAGRNEHRPGRTQEPGASGHESLFARRWGRPPRKTWLARRLLKHKRHGMISRFAAPSRPVRMGGYRGAEPTIQSRPALPLCTGLTLVPIPLPQVRDSTLGSSRFCLLALVSTPARYGNVKSHAVYKAALFQLGRLVEGLA